MRKGIELLEETVGEGAPVERGCFYRIQVRFWLHRGDPVRWPKPWGLIANARLLDDGTTLVTDVRMDRVFLINGLFYGMEGMRLGGTRKLRIAPHMAYRAEGVPGTIPPDALLTCEVSVLSESESV